MSRWHLIILLYFILANVHAQTNVPLFHQLIEDNKKEHSKQNTARDKQTIVTANEAANKNLVQKMQERYKSLQTRFNSLGVLMDAGTILLNASPLVKEIVEKQTEIVKQAQEHPAMILMALEAETEFVKRSNKLIRYLTVLVLVGTDFTQMKASDRKMLLAYVLDELKQIRSMSGHLATTLTYANRSKSFINYPFANYVNQDKRLTKEIFKNYKDLVNKP